MNTFYKSEDICIKEDTRNNIVFINFLRSSVSELNYELYHDNIINVYDKYEKLNKKIVLIFDTTKLGTMFSLKFAKAEANFFKPLDDRTIKIVNSMYTICSSSIIKKGFNFFIELMGSPVPCKLVNSLEEAINQLSNINYA